MRSLTLSCACDPRAVVRLITLAGVLGPLAACETQAPSLADGGVAQQLIVQDPPGSQIGLRYGTSVNLVVRYLLEDASETPIGGAPVKFAIFGDPGGSTLARSAVNSDSAGRATVALTAGSRDASFSVQVTAAGAAPVTFSISVSQLEFVRLDVELSDPLPDPGSRSLTALLYQGQACAALPATATTIPASRTLTTSPAAATTLSFINLLSQQYAIVGRVEAGGRLVAYGCIDVPVALDPPGAHLGLPVPLSAVRDDVTGEFDLTTAIFTSRAARSDGLFADYDVLDRCPGHLGQILLDEIATRAPAGRQTLIAAARGSATPSASGSSTVQCRPAMVGASSSLDVGLDNILTATAPGNARTNLLADLDAILAEGVLSSTLDLALSGALPGDGPSAPTRLSASHQAVTVTFAIGGQTHSEDLLALGLPVLGQSDIASGYDGATLTIGAHSLPIGLAARWGDAFAALSIAVRFPALADATAGGWATATINAAQSGAATGCAAVEAVICQTTGTSGCAGTLVAPCTNAVIAVAARLDAPFSDPRALDLQGQATTIDTNGALVVDSLMPGMFTATGIVTGTLSFTGQRGTP